MTISKVGAAPDISAQDMIADEDGHASMSQQDVWDTHGHEMHPQQFVRLVGCHDARAAHHEAAHRGLVQA